MESQARDMASPGNCGISVQTVQRDAILTITMYKNALTVVAQATTPRHYVGDFTESVESVSTKSLIIELMFYVRSVMRYATS